jgi:hypothetical protein
MASKSRKPVVRLISLVRPGLVRILEGHTETFYTLAPVPADWGRAFRICKADIHGMEIADPYHVHLDAELGDSCDCLGSLKHGHCKHRSGLRALLAAGKLN